MSTPAPEGDAPSVSPLLEWYRVDQSRPILRALVVAAGVELVGFIFAAIGFGLARFGPDVRFWATLLGGVLIVVGPVIAIFGLKGVLSEESFIALHTDHLRFQHGLRTFRIEWSDLERAHYDATARAVVLVGRSGEHTIVTERFAGTTEEDLAKRIEEVRRKVSFNLLAR